MMDRPTDTDSLHEVKKYTTSQPVLGNTLLEVVGVVLPLLILLLILYLRELLLYSIFYPETRYSTQILLKSLEKF